MRSSDKLFYYLLKTLAWGVVGLLAAMILVVLWMSWEALGHFGLRFFVDASWDSWREEFGALAFIYGTLVTSFIAVLLAVPVSLAVALYLNELAPPWIARPLGFFVEMLAAIPSIVYGLWGLFVLAPFLRDHVQPLLATYLGFLPFFQGPQMGVGLLGAGVILAIMIIPTIASISREVFKSVPESLREAALGLGATRWEMLRIAVLRVALSGVMGAVVLGLGRALGETMAVTMLIGNRPQIVWSLFESGQTMASILANQYAEADSSLHLSALTAVGLALFVVSLVINSLARWIIWRMQRVV